MNAVASHHIGRVWRRKISDASWLLAWTVVNAKYICISVFYIDAILISSNFKMIRCLTVTSGRVESATY